ncbi:hypothetical protein C0995_013871 [Termitomyces sp. Mi166|nr:hypothetical protein C0995_013871 [Termitomyces sp. Mi166\
MPTYAFRFPCFSASVGENFAQEKSPSEAPVRKETTRTKTIPPTGVEYAIEAAKGGLYILSDVAQFVPLPGFDAAIKLVVNSIKASDDSQANLESAEELKIWIQELVTALLGEHKDVLSNKYKEIKEGDIPEGLRHDLETFKNLNDSKVKKCSKKMQNSITKFQLKRTTDHSKLLVETNALITLLKDSWESYMQLEVNKVMPNSAGVSSLSSRAPIPANTTIFHGRDSLVNDLVDVIVARVESRQHICLSGPGGMGKTSTALAVMNHEKVKGCFSDDLRVWVPCVKATSVSLFLDTLHTSLAISQRKGDIRGNILSELRASPPIVILLDNFETPWNVLGEQSEVERVLRDMNQFAHVTLFVTMRSSSPPCGDIPWHHVDLEAVEIAAAREIYTSWYPQGGKDEDLSPLLELIGRMPLAVTLMAKIAKEMHLSATQLVRDYNTRGTSMLKQGSDAQNSVDVCIDLSVKSPRMDEHPEALNLLSMISMLPTGTSYTMLSEWWANKLVDLTGALGVLKSTSLVEERSPTYFVLPVIQRYILNPVRFKSEVRISMFETACAFLKQHEPEIGKMHIARLSEEEENLEAVLLQATATELGPHIIRDGLLLLARYQRYHRPRVHAIKHALKLARDIGDKTLQGDILLCYHEISHALYQHEEALEQAQEALKLFFSVSDKKKAAMSHLAMNESWAYLGDKSMESRKETIETAQADFESVGDEGGVGLCYLALGVLFYQGWEFQTALTSLEKAKSIFQKVKNQPRHVECTRYLATVYFHIGQYDLAYSSATSSLEEGERIGHPTEYWNTGGILGFIMSARGEYEESLEQFRNCLEVCKNELGIMPQGVTLEGLGLACAQLGKTTDARKAFEESLQQYVSQDLHSSKSGIIRINFFLRSLKNPQLKPTDKERRALRTWYSDDYIDRILSPT